jgi:8-oxo-dGTP diphosphatase
MSPERKKKAAARRAEREFLAAYDASRFPHPSVTVDIALVSVVEGRLEALLVRRAEHPDRGLWSLPGGFVRMDESLDRAAARVLEAKAGLRGRFLEQLYTFGEPGRDPRTRVITVAYYALVEPAALRLPEDPNVRCARLQVPWAGERGGPVQALDRAGKPLPLAFDHAEILGLVVRRLRGKLDYAPIGFELLPREFTLLDLQSVHEAILGRRLNKDSFRRRMLDSGLLAPTGRREEDVGHRPAEFYRFRRVTKEA